MRQTVFLKSISLHKHQLVQTLLDSASKKVISLQLHNAWAPGSSSTTFSIQKLFSKQKVILCQ